MVKYFLQSPNFSNFFYVSKISKNFFQNDPFNDVQLCCKFHLMFVPLTKLELFRKQVLLTSAFFGFCVFSRNWKKAKFKSHRYSFSTSQCVSLKVWFNMLGGVELVTKNYPIIMVSRHLFQRRVWDRLVLWLKPWE